MPQSVTRAEVDTWMGIFGGHKGGKGQHQGKGLGQVLAKCVEKHI